MAAAAPVPGPLLRRAMPQLRPLWEFQQCRSFGAGRFNQAQAGLSKKPQGPSKTMTRTRLPGQERVPTQTGAGIGSPFGALQAITSQLGGSDGGAGTVAAWRERNENIRRRKADDTSKEIFGKVVEFLMAPDVWTFGNYLAFQRKILDLSGAMGWRRRLTADDPNIQNIEREVAIMEAMTPSELDSNHKSVFTPEAIKLIAEKSGAPVKAVEKTIMNHDMLRGDRRWYKILKQFGRPLPETFADRQEMAEYDRPPCESELEKQEEMVEKWRRDHERSRPQRMFCVYFRQPSVGGNRWSTRPPRDYPVQWRMRPERRERLAGVGVPGGGGDRGRPWGALGKHYGSNFPVPVK